MFMGFTSVWLDDRQVIISPVQPSAPGMLSTWCASRCTRLITVPSLKINRPPLGYYLVLMITLPAPLLAVISTVFAALSKSDDWYVCLSIPLNCGSMMVLPNPVVA